MARINRCIGKATERGIAGGGVIVRNAGSGIEKDASFVVSVY